MAATDMLCGEEEEEEEGFAELVAKDNHMSLYPSSTLTPRLLSPASIREETVAWRRVSTIWNLISAVVWKRKKKEPRLYSYGRARSVNHNLQTHHPLLPPNTNPKVRNTNRLPSFSLSVDAWLQCVVRPRSLPLHQIRACGKQRRQYAIVCEPPSVHL